MLEAALGHLVQNALEAVRGIGRVVLRAACSDIDQVIIEVADDGPGMSADFVRDELFRPLTTTKRTGQEKEYQFPTHCPVCGAAAIKDPEGAILRCTGVACPAQLQQRIQHFASRQAMDIEGMGADRLTVSGGHTSVSAHNSCNEFGACLANHCRIFWFVQVHSMGWA